MTTGFETFPECGTPIGQGNVGECKQEAAPQPAPRRFNFARHWRSRIVPLLDDPVVVRALTLGLKLYDIDYEMGEPPWLCGRGPLNGQRARKGCLSWYQPWGRCHYIAPFCLALGQRLYPDLNWGFVSSDAHTVVVGWGDDCDQPEWVMDILLFREKSAQESLNFAKGDGWRFYDSLISYAASFSTDPEAASRHLQRCFA